MKIHIKKALAALFISGSISATHASVCDITPGSVTCGKGTVSNLTGNGMVAVHGTTVSGATLVNGTLKAENATFSSIEANGSVQLSQCTVNNAAKINGSLTATSTRFENTLTVSSSTVKLINSKVSRDLHIRHTDATQQTVHLNDSSEVSGNIIFDDGKGEVILRGGSKIGGEVIGGRTILK